MISPTHTNAIIIFLKTARRINTRTCLYTMSSPISLHVVLDNVPQKKYPNYHVKLLYQYRIKLEMSTTTILNILHINVSGLFKQLCTVL